MVLRHNGLRHDDINRDLENLTRKPLLNRKNTKF